MLKELIQAGEISLPTIDNDRREFWLGCVGIRKDGAVVTAKNGPVNLALPDDKLTTNDLVRRNFFLPESHAEGRVLRKLGHGGIIYVARIGKQNRDYSNAAPCKMCSIRIKSFGVEKVYYTINNFSYGIWNVKKDTFRVVDV